MSAASSANAHAAPAPAPASRPADEPFGYCFNTSTIREQKIGIVAELELAAKVGYHAVEPWMRDLDTYAAAGGSLKDLGKRIRDLGITIESAIGFAQWIVDDDAARAAGLEQAKRDMATLIEIGGKRIAAPPVGAQKISGMNLSTIAERYWKLLELGIRWVSFPSLKCGDTRKRSAGSANRRSSPLKPGIRSRAFCPTSITSSKAGAISPA